MSLLDDITAESSRPKVRCTVAVVGAQLAPDDAAGFKTAVDSPDRYTAKSISAALAKRDIIIGTTTIQRHRRKECKCHS